eukprot:1143056-Pelagomonas_calceolata.AAC.1
MHVTQEDEEGPGQQIAVVGGPGGGDASARGRAPFMSFNLADVPHQPQQAAAHQQEVGDSSMQCDAHCDAHHAAVLCVSKAWVEALAFKPK